MIHPTVDIHTYLKPGVRVHLAGIGGVSMCPLAEVLRGMGLTVQGSDMSESDTVRHLRSLGIDVAIGHSAENLKDCDLVIRTAAIHDENPEISGAIARGIPVYERAQAWGAIMQKYANAVCFSGTHGKTTTTSMATHIFMEAGADPTVMIGGTLPLLHSGYRVGQGDTIILESCEYCNSFLNFFPTVAVILNVEEDHLDFFKDLEDIRNSFHKFEKLLPADGCLIINGAIDRLQEITGDLDCRVITFNKEAVNSDGSAADYYPSDITFDEFGHPSFTLHRHGEVSGSFSLQVPGEHNVCNAIASIALADLLKIDREVTASALHGFTGTDRRFEYKGTIGGVTIVDDYAHHPTEIAATLHAAANYPHKTLWCVFQPHTYTRTKAFMKDFA